jgi:PAS domain S-box-containing protein
MSSENKYWKDWFNGTLKCLTEPIVVIDRNFKILISNSKAEELLGWGKEDIEGKDSEKILKILDDTGKDILKPSLKKSVSHESITFASLLVLKDGNKLSIECTISSVKDFENNLIGYIVLFKDISEERLREKEIKESERKYKGLFENAIEGIFIFNEQSDIIDANPAACKMYGFKKEEFLKLSVKDIFPHKTSEESIAIWNGFLKVGYIDGLYKFQLKNGTFNYIDFKARTNFLPGLHLAVFSNVTEKIIIERALRNSEANLKAVFNNTSQRIILLDMDLKILTVNSAAQDFAKKMLGAEFQVGDLFFSNKLQSLGESYMPLFERVKQGEIVIREICIPNDHWIEHTLVPVFDNKRNVKGVCLISVDITYRKKAQISLTESEARFRSLVQNSSDIITILNNDRKISYSSSSIEKILGYKQEDIFNMDILKYVHPDDVQQFSSILEKIISHSESEMSLEYRFQHAEGYFLELETTFNNLFNNEHVKGIVLNSRDISERKRHLAALKVSEEKFRNLAENSPDLIYIINIDLKRAVYFNREKVLGYKTKELEFSDTWNEIVHPDDKKEVLKHWSNFLLRNSEKSEAIEFRIRRKTGEYEWVVNRHTIIEKNKNGAPSQVLLNVTIITERRNAEEALRESQARLTTLIENTSDIIWSVDRDLFFTTMNSAFKKLFKSNYKKVINVGDSLIQSLPDDIKDEWLSLHNKALAGNVFSTEFNLVSKSKNLSYEISYNPIYSDENKISGVSVFARDITRRKIAENDIIRTNFELDSFVYRASHDLRAPLRSVLGLTSLAKTEEDISQRNNFLTLIDKSVNKLDTFISDLTNFSRNSRLEVTSEKIDFNMILHECIENLKYMDHAENIDIRIKLEENVDFYSDATRISIIMQNLISNSIKYRNTKINDSFVLIGIKLNADQGIIMVKDNGKGIKDEYLDKIFNMFFRASQDSYGSGLGLYITKQVVEKLNGSVSVDSQLGQGTEFMITLPNLKK